MWHGTRSRGRSPFEPEPWRPWLTTSLIADPKDRLTTIPDVQALPFFTDVPFASLRERDAPFVPMLDGETDVGYFDSFESAEDMAKYAEVFKKQRDVEAVEEKGMGKRNDWVSCGPLAYERLLSTRLDSHSGETHTKLPRLSVLRSRRTSSCR